MAIEFILYYLAGMAGLTFVISINMFVNYITFGMFSVIAIGLIDYIITLTKIIIFAGLWVSTVGVFTKPLDTTFIQFMKIYYTRRNNKIPNKITGKILENIISKADMDIVDYYILKICNIVTPTTSERLIFIGCLNNWYEL